MRRIRKTRKKALDAIPRTSTPRKQGKSSRKSTVASNPYGPAKPVEYEFTAPFQVSPFEMAKPEKLKRGRPTIPDNFLLGSRNSWLRMFEDNWAEIGFQLLEIRRTGRGTNADVREAFDSLKGTDAGLFSKVFLQGTPERATAKEIRANRSSNSTLHRKVEGLRSRKRDLMRDRAEVEDALEKPGHQYEEILRTEEGQIIGSLQQADEDLKREEDKLKQSDQQNQNQEAYWYCSQLLNFLNGKRQNAVEPLNLANALAGLPHMGWRESETRCSEFDRSPCVSLSYLVVELVSRMLRNAPKDSTTPPIEFFRSQILALPKKDNSIRAVLCRAWRDFRLAVEQCWNDSKNEMFMPYAITSAFLRNHARTKILAEQILAEREMLS